jgi:hypothetical protein
VSGISSPSGRTHAALAWIAAALLLGLILLLAGALPFVGSFDDFFSVAAAAGTLVVFVLVASELRSHEPWSTVSLALGSAGLTLVLVGDALQHVVFHAAGGLDTASLWAAAFAIRDGLGNTLFYVGLLILGVLLMVHGRRWIGALAFANALLGFLDLAFASSLGLPPHTNFLLLVVWDIAVGVTWWRMGANWAMAQPAPEVQRLVTRGAAVAQTR